MIKFFDIYKQDKIILRKNLREFENIIKKSNFINGDPVKKFEKKFAKYCGTKYAVGCNSGTDALFLALKSLNLKEKSEVILPAQTYCSTLFAVLRANLTPVLVDIQNNNPTLCSKDLIKKINNKTSAIICVHLYGQVCNIKDIKKIIKKKKIYLIEDAAQAHGANDNSYKKSSNKAGSLGDIGCFSFYPGKNLGAYGDGGAITTNSKKLYIKIKKLRNLGGIKKYEHSIIGYNSRLDTLQAAVLLNKLDYLDKNNNKRKNIAKLYHDNINNPKITKLKYTKGCVYHQYVILSREEKKIINLFNKNKIQFGKHYPEPIHRLNGTKKLFKNKKFKNAEIFSKYGLSLPIDPNSSKKDIIKVCGLLNSI